MLQIFDWIASFAPRHVEHEKQQPATRDVPQKSVPEAEIAMRPLDQTWNIRDGRTPIICQIHHANHRVQRRERIRRNLRLGR